MMLARTITLPGAVNLRDFGGYATRDGRRVRHGLLFRSGLLSRLEPQGRRGFLELDVRLICDLRRHAERDKHPPPFPADAPQRLEIPIDPGNAVDMRAQRERGTLSLQQRVDFMVAINRDLARDHAQDYARMFEALLALDEGGFLVHCSAGKDRTGFACALIHHALGVPAQTVLEDYLLTNEAIDYEGYVLPVLAPRLESGPLPDQETIMSLAGVRPEYLRAAFETIETEFEGVERYIEDAIGLDTSKRERLRERLLD